MKLLNDNTENLLRIRVILIYDVRFHVKMFTLYVILYKITRQYEETYV